MKQNIYFFEFNKSLFDKNHSFISFISLLTILKIVLYLYKNEKCFYYRQTLLGLNILSLYENHQQKLGITMS